MKPRWFAVLVSFLALGAGCTQNNETVFIRSVPIPNPLNFCQTLADPTLPQLLEGLMDLGLTPIYQEEFLVGNQTVPRGDSARLHPETSRVTFNEAEVQIFDGGTNLEETNPDANPNTANCPSGKPCLSVPVTGFADEASDTIPGYGLVLVNPLIPAADTAQIIATHGSKGVLTNGVFVVARLQIKGATLGGDSVETGVFDWPIYVCQTTATQSCIESIPPSACANQIVPACFPGQDQPHDCRQVALSVKGYENRCTDATSCQCIVGGRQGKCM